MLFEICLFCSGQPVRPGIRQNTTDPAPRPIVYECFRSDIIFERSKNSYGK